MTKCKDYQQLRDQMVQNQLIARGISNRAVLSAMRKVPREMFVSPALAEEAYEDSPLPIEEGQTISQPYMVAWMTETLDIKPGGRVLEIGTGSGYAAAILGEIADEVYTIEYFSALAEQAKQRLEQLGYTNIHVRQGNGLMGWKENAPFQAISVTAAGQGIPAALLEQLEVGGKLLMPLGESGFSQNLICVIKQGTDEYEAEELGPVAFVPLLGV